MDYSLEWSEFIDRATRPLAPGESIAVRVRDAISEACDIAGGIVDDLDEENRAVELPALQAQAIAALRAALQKLDMSILLRGLAQSAGPALITAVTEAAADKSSAVAVIRDEYVVPALDFSILSLAEWRLRLAPDAPALHLPTRPTNGSTSDPADDVPPAPDPRSVPRGVTRRVGRNA